MTVTRTLAFGSLVALIGGAIPYSAAAAAATTLPRLAQPAGDRGETPPPVPASAEAGAVWYVVIDGEKVGPLTDAALLRRMERGEITPDTLVWRAGMADWQKVAANETIMAKRVAAGIGRAKPATPLDEKFTGTI